MSGQALADAASGLVGTPFRLHGRDPQTGVDCLGLLGAALDAIGQPSSLPVGYRLRNRITPDLDAIARRCGLVTAHGCIRAGDVIVVRAGSLQLHLLIATWPDGHVHAHAGLRRVVRVPGWPTDPIVGRWRLTDQKTES